MAIRIVTDSTCDLGDDLVRKYNIEVIPLTVHFKDKHYKDRIEISSSQFFKMLKESEELPKTSQVNPAEFEDAFNKILDNGDEIIGIFISNELSGTYNSAKIAKDIIDSNNIHIIDSRTVTVGLAALVLKAAQLAEEGLSSEKVVEEIERCKNKLILFAIADTLEYLKKGGRLSAAKAAIANVLNLKPIITTMDGIVEPVDKVRGIQKGISYFIEHIQGKVDPDVDIMILNAESDENAEKLISRFKEECGLKNFHICNLGSIVGTHLGPGAIGFCVIEK